jgi:hypothetical protein
MVPRHVRSDLHQPHSHRSHQGADPPRLRAAVRRTIRFGVHGAIKHFYGVEPDEELPATLDHIIAAVGG